MELSVVVPVYKEEENVPEFVRRILPILAGTGLSFEVIFALDPSPDGTEAAILREHAKDPRIRLVTFSRRFGQPMATLGGLAQATGDATIVMDVDLQDPPELIVEMIARWREGYDVVYAQRRSRDGETLVKRLVSRLGYRVINRIADVEIMSMLMPASARHSNIVAAIPGLDFMPAPMTLTRATFGSAPISRMPSSCCSPRATSSDASRSASLSRRFPWSYPACAPTSASFLELRFFSMPSAAKAQNPT